MHNNNLVYYKSGHHLVRSPTTFSSQVSHRLGIRSFTMQRADATNTTDNMLSLCYCRSNMTKRHFQKNNRKCLILSVGPVCILSMADNGNSASSCVTSDNGLFLSEVVGYSTDIAVLITAFLIRMSVLAG